MARAPVIPVFVCPTCARKSYHPRDIEELFCEVCGFVEINDLKRKLEETEAKQ